MEARDLMFFDKNGNNYGFVFNEETSLWGGSIFIDKVSRGLFETQKIVILQKYPKKAESFDNSGVPTTDNPSGLVRPVYTYQYGKPNGDSDECYLFEWDDSTKEVDEIRLYGIDLENECDQTPDTSSLDYNEYTCPTVDFIDSFVVGCATQTLNVSPSSYTMDDETVYVNDYSDITDTDAAFLDICFCNTDDQYNTFRRDLMLYTGRIVGYDADNKPIIDNKVLVGVFSVYAESVEEDERLSVLCANLGYNINNADFSIFKETDIKEQLIDYDFINLKRKEILMEGHNIYPYVGSYKSVLNAIRYFGYDNVSIKEWWKNVNINSQDYGKYFLATSYSLENREIIKGKNNLSLPNKNFRKTPKITLAYKINSVDSLQQAQSSYYGHGYPQTNENFDYTIEEAVIKLYGLKRKLDKEFLPMSTRIVDIVGEADAFYVNTVRHVMTANMTENTYAGNKYDFDVENGDEENTFYLEDLRPFGLHALDDPNWSGDNMVGESSDTQHYIGGNPPTKSLVSADPNPSLQELGMQNLSDFNTNFDTTTHPMSSSLIPVAGDKEDVAGLQAVYPAVVPPNDAYPKILGAGYNENAPWNYYEYYLDQLNEQGLTHTNYYLAHFSDYYPNLRHNSVPANTFDYDSAEYLPDTEYAVSGALVRLVLKNAGESCSRIKWDIYKGETDTPEFHAQIFGMYSDGYGDIGVVLPYVGTYDVVMTVFGFDNSISVKTKQNCIIVEPKEVEMTGWCVMAREYCTWNTDICWDDATFEWRLPIINESATSENKSASYESMDRATFIGDYIEEEDPDSSMYAYEFEDSYVGLQGIQEPIGYGAKLVSPGPYFWNNIKDCTWDDLNHLWWDAMCISGDLPAYMDFGYFDMNGNCTSSPDNSDTLLGNWLEIVTADYKYGSIRIPSSLSGGLTQMSEIVRLLNASTDPVISRYHYSWVYDYTGGIGDADIAQNEPLGFKITAVAKTTNRSADILYAGIVDAAHHATADNGMLVVKNNDTNPQRNQFRYASNTLSYNPNWFNCVYINNVTRVPRFTDVNFNYSNCKIVGKKNPHWVITNLNTGTVFESDKKNFHRLFRERGCYEVALTLNDNNGNTYTAKRNMLIIE